MGKSKIKRVNFILNINIKINSTIIDNKKFIKFEITTERGIISRGKAIFLLRFALSTIDVVDIDKERLKKYHGRSTLNKNIGYLSIWIFIIKENTIDNINIINKGFNNAHKKPNIAFLYLTLKSLAARLKIRSL